MDNKPRHAPQPIESSSSSGLQTIKPRKKKTLLRVVCAVVAVVVIAIIAAAAWYFIQLSAPNESDTARVRITIQSGITPSQIGTQLKEEGLIRSDLAFGIYTRLEGVQDKLQAGVYSLSSSESMPQIVEHLVKGGASEEITVTFLPGATLTDTTAKDELKKTDVTTVLRRLGYEEAEIRAALAKTYDHPLFVTKPASADLEGYIYGETYQVSAGASVEDILTRTFDEYYKVLQANNLIEGFSKQGLTLYEGITLASIVQRESGGDDKAQIAQVFYLRLAQGMQLGSDVTYQYIADKDGMPRDTNYDSPYNTRRYTGLPPGPIASPGLASLKAVAAPATGDYLFFLSGDDDITYFARTNAEHQANISAHCQKKCQIL